MLMQILLPVGLVIVAVVIGIIYYRRRQKGSIPMQQEESISLQEVVDIPEIISEPFQTLQAQLADTERQICSLSTDGDRYAVVQNFLRIYGDFSSRCKHIEQTLEKAALDPKSPTSKLLYEGIKKEIPLIQDALNSLHNEVALSAMFPDPLPTSEEEDENEDSGDEL